MKGKMKLLLVVISAGVLVGPLLSRAQQSPSAPGKATFISEPLTMTECESNDKCSTWTFLGSQGNGQGPSGEIENLSVEKFDAGTMIVHRADSTGASAGFTADYTGTRDGNHIEGHFTSSWPGHWDSMTSKWSATIAASQAQGVAALPPLPGSIASSQWNGQPPDSGGNPDVIGVVEGSDHALYGATASGLAETRHGVLYKVSSKKGFEALHVFGRTPEDGQGPSQSLYRALDGSFYGTTAGGGAGCGTIFRVTEAGNYTQLHSFVCATEGGSPAAGSLTQGHDGLLYGSARVGGVHNAGTVYKATLTGTVTVLHSFGGQGDGSGPDGSILQAGNYFYGTTNTGGAANIGITYRVTAEGKFEKLHDFIGRGDGSQPNAGFALDKDGNFFSTTTFGGAFNRGTIFKMTPTGIVTILHSFSGADGTIPSAATPHLSADGYFYGVTTYGGARGLGTLYRISPSGAFAKLYDFDGVTGANPGAGLKLAGDGNLYGTTGKGGQNNSGVIFQLTPGGRVTPLMSFAPTLVSQQDAFNATRRNQQDLGGFAMVAAILGALVLASDFGDSGSTDSTAHSRICVQYHPIDSSLQSGSCTMWNTVGN